MLTANKEAIKETASQIIESLQEFNQLDSLNFKERRELTKTLRRFIKKNKLGLLRDITDVQEFIVNVFDGTSTASEDGVKVCVKFLREQRNDKALNTQPRSYQREKVASYEWKCEIIKTVIIDKQFKIPPIHIRIIRNDNSDVIGFEIADGQQRVTAILDFMDIQDIEGWTFSDDECLNALSTVDNIKITRPVDRQLKSGLLKTTRDAGFFKYYHMTDLNLKRYGE